MDVVVVDVVEFEPVVVVLETLLVCDVEVSVVRVSVVDVVEVGDVELRVLVVLELLDVVELVMLELLDVVEVVEDKVERVVVVTGTSLVEQEPSQGQQEFALATCWCGKGSSDPFMSLVSFSSDQFVALSVRRSCRDSTRHAP